MILRSHYVHQLSTIRNDVQKLGALTEQALHRALSSLKTWNLTIATQVLHDDAEIDALHRHIEHDSVILLATQQPVAGGLRFVISTVSIADELERIGDYACGLARRVERIINQPTLVHSPPMLFQMGTLAHTMLTTSLEAFATQELTLMEQLQQDEAEVDRREPIIRAQLIAHASADGRNIDAMMNLIEIAARLERVADRATNIGERVIYMRTSEVEELNP